MSDLSLFDIERGLHELMDAWQDARKPEEIQAAELALRNYAEAEVRKVDGIRRYLSACETQIHAAKSEMQAQAQRVRMWEARRDRLKSFCFDVMKGFGLKKLEGSTGSLAIRGNGGVEPLVVTDEFILPDDLRDAAIVLRLDLWKEICHQMRQELLERCTAGQMLGEIKTPNNKRIREALAKGPVPGARLEPRGESLVVK